MMGPVRGLLVTLVCLSLVVQTAEGGWFQDLLKNIGDAVKNVVKTVAKPLCKIGFGIVCPAVLTTAGGLLAGATQGLGTALVQAGVALGTNLCLVQEDNCKRSASRDLTGYVRVPFSHRFSDYDTNGDEHIVYEEFVFSVMRSLPLGDPEDLVRPFSAADLNGDKKLDKVEFQKAPFFFADYVETPSSDKTTSSTTLKPTTTAVPSAA